MRIEKLKRAMNLLFIALGADIVVTGLVAITDFWALGVLNNIRQGITIFDQSTIDTMDFWMSFASIMILTLAAVGFALVRWISACYEYSQTTLKATGFAQKKWKTLGWVVPFVNLFKPYQVLNEIYKVGISERTEGEEWKKSSGSGMLLRWWIFWVIAHMVMGVIGQSALKSSFSVDLTLNYMIGMYNRSLIVCALSLIVAALWFAVAGRLTRRLLNRPVLVVSSIGQTDFSDQRGVAIPTPVAALFTEAVSSQNFSPSPSQAVVDEDRIYTEIAQELETGVSDKGLWTRLFADCGGDEKQTKVLYIKQRAERLISAERLRLELEAREHASKLERVEKLLPLPTEAEQTTCKHASEIERSEKLHPTPTEAQQMQEYGITFDGQRYSYKQYNYEKLYDAINYAKLQERKETGANRPLPEGIVEPGNVQHAQKISATTNQTPQNRQADSMAKIIPSNPMIDVRLAKRIEQVHTEIDNAYERARKNLGFENK